jgi:hypothetical protein
MRGITPAVEVGHPCTGGARPRCVSGFGSSSNSGPKTTLSTNVDNCYCLLFGGERRLDRIHQAQWSRAARELGVPEDALRHRARQLLTAFPDAFHDALVQVGTPEALDVWAHSNQPLAEHTAACLKQLNQP